MRLNLAVDLPDLYDPKVNRAYAELAEHCGYLVARARAFKPRLEHDESSGLLASWLADLVELVATGQLSTDLLEASGLRSDLNSSQPVSNFSGPTTTAVRSGSGQRPRTVARPVRGRVPPRSVRLTAAPSRV